MAEPALTELAETEAGLKVRWRAFELRPEPVELLDPHGDYLTNVWRDHVYPLAEKMKMPLKLPPIQPRSRLAHEAAKWAESYARSGEYTLSLFRAFFEFGQDIGDIQVLMKLAVDMNLDPENLAQALNSHQFTEDVVGDEEAAQALGIRAVPSFVSEGQVLASGVQTADRLRELLTTGPGISMF